jgi:hypothetical protein
MVKWLHPNVWQTFLFKVRPFRMPQSREILIVQYRHRATLDSMGVTSKSTLTQFTETHRTSVASINSMCSGAEASQSNGVE